MKLVELRTNHVTEPLGYSYAPLSFSWKVEDAGKAKEQKYAQIIIKKGEKTVYDSGENAEASSLDYPVDLMLEPRSRYEWTGKWITPGSEIVEDDAMAGYILEKTFSVQEPGNARLYLCALGVYECYINGKKVGKEFLAPGYHSYDFHLQTSVYDVTEYLVSGENRINMRYMRA